MEKIIYLLLFFAAVSNCTKPGNLSSSENDSLNVLWSYAYDADRGGAAPRAVPLLSADAVITSGDKSITAVNLLTGDVIWKTHFDNSSNLRNRQFGVSGNLVSGGVDKSIRAWHISDGTLAWEFQFPENLPYSNLRPITGSETGFYAVSGTGPGRLFRFNRDGEINVISMSSRPYINAFYDGLLIVGFGADYKGGVMAIEEEGWRQIWSYNPGDDLPHGYPAYSPILVESDTVFTGTVYAGAETTFCVFALAIATGEPIWKREGLQAYWLTLDGDHVYVYDGGGVHKLRKDTGATVWHTDFGSSGAAPIAVGYGHVYAPHSGAMRILDAESGAIVDIVSPPDGSYYWLVTVGRGRVFAQSTRHLYAFAPWGRTEALE